MTKTLTYEEKQKKEQDEKERRYNRLQTVITQLVAQDAFKEFTAVRKDGEFDPTFYLEALDGRKINLSTDRYGNEGRIYVSGSYPRNYRGAYVQVREAPSITVALDKDVTLIGKDIARRFLPDYEKKFKEVQAEVNQGKARHDTLVQVGLHVARRLQERFDVDRVDNSFEISGYRPEYIKVQSYDGEDFRVELTIKGFEKLNQLLDFIKPHKEVTAPVEKDQEGA